MIGRAMTHSYHLNLRSNWISPLQYTSHGAWYVPSGTGVIAEEVGELGVGGSAAGVVMAGTAYEKNAADCTRRGSFCSVFRRMPNP